MAIDSYIDQFIKIFLLGHNLFENALFGQIVCGHLTILTIFGFSPKCLHKVGNTHLPKMSLYAVALSVPFTGAENSVPALQYACARSEVSKKHVCQG